MDFILNSVIIIVVLIAVIIFLLFSVASGTEFRKWNEGKYFDPKDSNRKQEIKTFFIGAMIIILFVILYNVIFIP